MVVERGMCGHRGARCAVTTEFLVGCFCVYFLNVGKWLAAPRVSHARLLPPLYRHHSSVYICLYLSGWSGVCVGTGAHAARQQPFFWWAVDAFLCYVGEGLVEPRVTHARPLLSSYRQRSSVCIDLYWWW